MQQRLDYLRQRCLELDRLLRGDATRPEALAGPTLAVSARGLTVLAILMAAFYGMCMGSFSLLKAPAPGLEDAFGPYLQVVASMVKTPALFFLTLVVTLPSLYVANALIGSRLDLLEMTRLLVASIAVNLAVLASLGTIVMFFSLTTTSYSFVVLLNVATFSTAGVLGLMFLLQTLHRVLVAGEPALTTAADEPLEPVAELRANEQEDPQRREADDSGITEEDDPGPLEMPEGQVLGQHTRLVFRCWVVLFSLVGAQMGWVLRPFIGNPDEPFSFFRAKESNIFAAIASTLSSLLFG